MYVIIFYVKYHTYIQSMRCELWWLFINIIICCYDM